jgi:hypothetical protein
MLEFHVTLVCSKTSKMINIAGIISIVLFYILILAVGLWAARKKQAGDDSEEEVMLAGRSIGLFVGIFTMTGESKHIAALILRLLPT